jgi:hypothetical protein
LQHDEFIQPAAVFGANGQWLCDIAYLDFFDGEIDIRVEVADFMEGIAGPAVCDDTVVVVALGIFLSVFFDCFSEGNFTVFDQLANSVEF